MRILISTTCGMIIFILNLDIGNYTYVWEGSMCIYRYIYIYM